MTSSFIRIYHPRWRQTTNAKIQKKPLKLFPGCRGFYQLLISRRASSNSTNIETGNYVTCVFVKAILFQQLCHTFSSHLQHSSRHPIPHPQPPPLPLNSIQPWPFTKIWEHHSQNYKCQVDPIFCDMLQVDWKTLVDYISTSMWEGEVRHRVRRHINVNVRAHYDYLMTCPCTICKIWHPDAFHFFWGFAYL